MRIGGVGLAGWVFADLLLALALIFVGVNAPLPIRAEATVAPTSFPTPSSPSAASASPTPSPPPQNVVSINSICRVLPGSIHAVRLSNADLDDKLVALLSDLRDPPRGEAQAKTGPQAKLVITFGYRLDDVGGGERAAQFVNKRFGDPDLMRRLGNLFASDTPIDVRSYGNGKGALEDDAVTIELFVAYGGPLPPGTYRSDPSCRDKE